MKNMSWSGKLKLNDYKSIALPTELQGRNLICRIFSLISQLNQSLKRIALMLAAVAARRDSASCSQLVTDLSVWSRYENLFQIQISFVCFHPVTIKSNGVENYEEELKIYKSCT